MQQISVIEIPGHAVIVADHGLDAELREAVLVVDISQSYNVGHDDVLVGHQDQRRMMATVVVELPDR